MPVPMVDFARLLGATEPQWQAHLAELHARLHFILGPQLVAFESEWAAYLGCRDTVGVANGTQAIELCLRDAGITRPNQEVITTALTAPFSGIGIVSAGCRIRFADVDAETLLLDPASVEDRATRKTAAIMPVHLYGQPCELPRFRALARSLGAVLIQDACQAHGARFEGKPFTVFGPYVAYSFYPTKNLGGMGDGGAVATASAAAARRLRLWRDGGRKPGSQVSLFAGINSRLDELQCCYLRAFLPRLDEWNQHRRRIAAFYEDALRDCAGVRLVRTGPASVRHLFVIRAAKRDRLRESLAKAGIATGVHYPVPLHRMPAFSSCGLRRGDLPHAERAAREIVSLPLFPYMPQEAAEQVVAAVRRFYNA